MSIRVLLCDEQPIRRGSLRSILAREAGIEVVGEASDGGEAVAAARRLLPDIALADVLLPAPGGLELARQLTDPTTQWPIRVVLLADSLEAPAVAEALRAGASGYLPKGCPIDVLVNAIRVVAGGNSMVVPPVSRHLLAGRAPAGDPSPERHPAIASLTSRELEVMQLIAEGLPNADIAAKLYLSERTVKSHVHRLLRKLGLRERSQIVVLAYRSGLVRAGP